jgi:hypothetical protein
MTQIVTFEEAIKASEGEDRTLLIGNGFSAKYFNYKTLLEKSGLDADGPLHALFKVLDTVDFEVVIKALEEASMVEKTYTNVKRATLLLTESEKLRRALVHAIRQIHPAHREDIQDGISNCQKFLLRFGTIFTLNYDLLLYWTILGKTNEFRDGFGLGKENNGYLGPFKSDAHCNIYNLHGGLHLFRTADDFVEKRLMGSSGVIDAIAETITQEKRLPLYVAEGSSIAKLAHIYAMPYLRHCYQRLGKSSGAFFIYGHSASTNDAHIYDALFNSDISHLYFCVHQPTTKIEDIDGELARYKRRNGSKVDSTFVDSETAKVWD